jgi:hypothetical protein
MDLFRQAVIDADIKTSGPAPETDEYKADRSALLIAEVHPGCAESDAIMRSMAGAAPILLVAVADRIGRAQHHKQQRQKQLFAGVRRAGDPALPVANDLLRERELRDCVQLLLNMGKMRRTQDGAEAGNIADRAQKLNVAAFKLALQLARAEVDQRPQVGVVVQRARNAVLFKRGF